MVTAKSGQRCRQPGIQGVTLHGRRHARAERAKEAGHPKKFAQEAPGHNCMAVQRAHAKRALVKIPPLDDYEQRTAVLEGPET